MKKHIITLSGFPGSGKSTVKKILADKLGYKTFSTGGYVRDMAYEAKLTLAEFQKIMDKDDSIDHKVDEKLKEINNGEEKYIVDAHLAFRFVPNGFNIFLTVSPEGAAKRIFNDAQSESRIKSGEVMESVNDAKKKIEERIQSNVERYGKLYDINPYDEGQCEFVVDTEKMSAEEVAATIVEVYEKWLKE